MKNYPGCIESQPQNAELEVFLFIYSLSEDNWSFKLEIVNIYSGHTASFKF